MQENAKKITNSISLLQTFRLVDPHFFENMFVDFLYIMINKCYVFDTLYQQNKSIYTKENFLQKVDFMVRYFHNNDYKKAYDDYNVYIKQNNDITYYTEPYNLEPYIQTESFQVDANFLKENGEFLSVYLHNKAYPFEPIIPDPVEQPIILEPDTTYPLRWWSRHVGLPSIVTIVTGTIMFFIYKIYQRGWFKI